MNILNNSTINHNIVNRLKKQDPTFNNNREEIENSENSFQNILQNKALQSEVLFSKHASMRLNSRNLKLSNTQMKRLEDGIKKAEQKGIKESLVLIDNIALLVNIKNKTVVTIDNNSNKVYTNIDGAVIV